MSGQSSGGKLVAMGDVTGTVSLLEVCESLAAPQANERKAIDLMFEREMKQEKNLEVRKFFIWLIAFLMSLTCFSFYYNNIHS